MGKKQVLETTQSKTKEKESKSLLNLGPDIYTKKQSKSKYSQGTKTATATTFEVVIELQVRMGTTEIKPSQKMVVTTERVIDTENQVFHAGVVTVIKGDGSSNSAPVEITQGIDAQDVRAILRLLGMAK